MGSDRGKPEKQSSKKVSGQLRGLFDVTTEDAFKFWNIYNGVKASGKSSKEAIMVLKKYALIEEEKILDYFMVLSMEILNKDVLAGKNDIKNL